MILRRLTRVASPGGAAALATALCLAGAPDARAVERVTSPVRSFSAPGVQARPADPELRDAEAREGTHVTLRGGIFLYDIGIGYELGVAAHLARDTLLEVTGYRATAAFPLQKSEGVGLLLQQFVGRKLYVKGGPRLRHLVEKDRISDAYDDLHVQYDLGLDFTFGMRFQRDAMVIGLDFLGVYVPVSRLSTKEQIADSTTGEVFTSDPAAFSPRIDVRAPAFYLGACF